MFTPNWRIKKAGCHIVNALRKTYTVDKMETRDAVMHVISREPFALAARRFPNQAGAIDGLYHELKRTRFTDPDDLKATYPSLDRMKYREKWWVIDIGGGHLRVMFFADFERGKIFIKHITTHAEYDKLIKYYREVKA